MWNGTAEILKNSPTDVVISARTVAQSPSGLAATASPTASRLVDPAMPYRTENPYASRPLEKAPRMRYFIAASFDFFDRRRNPTST